MTYEIKRLYIKHKEHRVVVELKVPVGATHYRIRYSQDGRRVYASWWKIIDGVFNVWVSFEDRGWAATDHPLQTTDLTPITEV